MSYAKKTIFPYVDENPLETIKGPASSFNTGLDNLLTNKFSQLIVSHAYIYWLRVPSWFEQDDDLKFFRALTQRNFNAFDGVSDVTLNSADRLGLNGNPIPVVAGVELGNNDFTIEHNESIGSPVRKMYQKWISLVRDPDTKISLYSRLFGVPYSDYENTGELMFMVVRQDANNEKDDILEFAMYYSGVFPTNVPLSHFAFRRGQEEAPVLSISFKGTPKFGPLVDDFARRLLRDRVLVISPESEEGIGAYLDSYGTDERVGPLVTSTTAKEFYNPEG